MIRRSDCAFALITLWALFGLGCQVFSSGALAEATEMGGAEQVEKEDEAAPFLLPAEALEESFVLRQTVTVRWADEKGGAQETSFDAAVQRQGKSLLLLGLGPMGGVGFTLSLEAGEVSFENRTGRALPFAPERMLADVQRVYYPWLPEVPPCNDCVRRGRRGGFEIEEHRRQGRVSRRRFVPFAIQPGEVARLGIDVRYSGDPGFAGLPLDARLRHEAFGYEVELKTLGIDWLD